MYRYIALFNHAQAHRDGDRAGIDASLRQIGLQLRQRAGHIDLYASDDTPVLGLPGGGALIGHVFSQRDNAPLLDGASLHALSAAQRTRYLIETHWGEYLLLHAPRVDPSAITVMREPSGGVACVYALQHGFITSDIAIATHAGVYTREIDWDSIAHHLYYPHLKTERTGLVGVRELLPGSQLCLQSNHSSVEQVWNPWDFVAASRRRHDPLDAQAQLRQAVASSVTCWARTDASVLLELSGGLDSSILAACLKDTTARVACCNLVTPVPGADERHYARQMSDLLGTELIVRTLGFDAAPVDFAPPAHAVAPSTWFLQHASNALKEAIGTQLAITSFFSGGGGDTVFCNTRTAAPAADAFRAGGLRAGFSAVHALAELHQCTLWKAGRLTIKKLLAKAGPPRKPERSFLPGTQAEIPLQSHPWFDAPPDSLPGDRERIVDLAGTQVFRDGLARSASWHLRMPLLSQPVVEACLTVPSWMWIAGGRNRAVARDAFADVLPAQILHRRSKGTFMNYSGAVYRRGRQQIRDYLLQGRLAGQGLLDADALRYHFDHTLADGDHSVMRIFDLCAVENWVRHQR
ncbi:asparagine synthase [Xanthomonas arboricola]|uniref:lasso peptide isopeptide bond-forming cyclase n=1 Tax=Xanthomonas arboricola TaxID=56448 RepID=UPI0007EDFF66|nr:lasso peptide isopeptide bond-forming cyclase [Xanthomonas arboricola]OBR77258.1 asparagine synthase [Xanthomonas arboricola]